MVEGKKICFLCPWMNNDGGLQRVVSNLANQFAVTNDVTVAIVSYSTEHPYYPLKTSIEISYLNKASLKHFGMVRRAFCKVLNYREVAWTRLNEECYYPKARVHVLQEFLEREKFDIVIASSGDISLLLSKTDRAKFDASLIGWQHNSFKLYFETPKKYYYGRKKLAGKLYKNLDMLVCLTEKDAREYKNKLSLNSCCIYNPLSYTSDVVADMQKKNIVFVGRLEWEQKGLDYLLEIMDLFYYDKRSKNWTFTIVGDGNDRVRLENELREKMYQDNVRLIGKTPDVKKYFLSSSICLNTSKWEGFGLVITEAMECGVPVIAFDTDGPSEIITDGKDGFIIPKYDLNAFTDKMLDLAASYEMRSRMSQEAKKKAGCFSMQYIFRQWNTMIDNISGGGV